MTPRTIDVSVVIPAYRAATFIGRAIESALSQAGVEVEIIVVDDACPIATHEAVRARYHAELRVRVLTSEANGGPSAARNKGFRAAQGEWIAILDADDAFDDGRLARLVSQARALSADVIADNVRLYDAGTGTLGPPRVKRYTAPVRFDLVTLIAGSRPGNADMDFGLLKPMFRTAFVRTLPALYREDIRHGEDFHFYVALLRAGARFFFVPDNGYQWTTRSSGQSQTNVDYQSQISDTDALLDSDDVRRDPALADAVRARSHALARLDRQRRFDALISTRRLRPAAAMIAAHPALAKRLVRTIARRLAR